MSHAVSFQTVIEYVEVLSTEDQDLLVLIQKRRIEQRRREIAANAVKMEALKADQAQQGTVADLRADLMGE